MCKETTNRTGDFYNPYEDVFKIIISPRTNTDTRLTKLWTDYIGKKVEIDTTAVTNIGNLLQKVSAMFTTDPIAYRLMTEIILYKRDFEKIIVKQDYSQINSDAKSNLIEMFTFLKETAKNPVIVLESESKFAAIISTNPETESIIDVHFWELSRGNIQKKSEKTFGEFWSEINRNKIIIEANVVYRNNIRKNLEQMVTTDAISGALVSAIINYKCNIDTITVKQTFAYFKPDKQNLGDMTYFLKNIAKNPVIVMISNSKFVAVISENPNYSNSVYLHIWDLSNCI